MASLNKVMVLGNLTRDPDIKHTPKGTAVTQLSIAINRKYTTENGDQKEEVTYVDIEAWGRLAEICAEHLSKGKSILVEGRLKLDTWEDKQTGEKKSKMRVAADVVQFLSAREDAQKPKSTSRREF
jgi:single-strand DNA-binding protein